MTPFAYVCAAIGGTVLLLGLAFVLGYLFEAWQIGRETDEDKGL